jgi:hypothetical protein
VTCWATQTRAASAQAVSAVGPVRKSSLGVLRVPLIGQLSNQEFVADVDHLLDDRGRSLRVRVPPTRACACGCGAAVGAPRKFINQDHYSVWLSQLRYFGRNRTRRIT